MKRINNKLAMALLRGVIVLSGLMTTMTIAFFTESLNSCVLTLLIGGITIVAVDETIKTNNNGTEKSKN